MRIKALSLWQPWADAIRVGVKQIETRSWPTTYRGWLAIHAAKKPIQAAIRESCEENAAEGFKDFAEHWVGDLSKLDFGAIICVVKLSDCRPTEALIEEVEEDEGLWGNYDGGCWGWLLNDGPVIDINPAIPVRGHQGLFDWEVPEAVAERIRK